MSIVDYGQYKVEVGIHVNFQLIVGAYELHLGRANS